ncbi:hypothetical protein [Priestia aryabhattai]|uniref:hypothetical protein n=1 Tax=Priestia aryabhattai TaxID=412384 RepID=UPI00245340C9|nr:hypothetical protein [Priestia aryabhattai]MDH3111333.1 hypothetical protein [Priestia aryabhattai]MDH3129893.1 hypothetical protein [Priestia aryabhattai]
MNVADLFSLLQGVSFLKPHLDVIALVFVIGALIYSIIWGTMELKGKYLANKGLELDNKNKSMDILKKEKKMSGPKKRPKNKTL